MEEHTGHAYLAQRALERAGYAVDLAHEIGTSLNVIAGNAELLRLDLRQHGIALSGLDTIVEQADRIPRLIERLLTFTRTKEQPADRFLAPKAIRAPALAWPSVSKSSRRTVAPFILTAPWGSASP
jgi:nitrogen-specific signal transduction histidine kinase